jgi:hypothetical protein
MDTASLVSARNALLLQLCCVFTEPTAEVWRQIALGWVLHRGPATVTGIFRTLGRLADRHWTVYEKFFYRAAWALDALSRALVVHVVAPMILESGAISPVVSQPPAAAGKMLLYLPRNVTLPSQAARRDRGKRVGLPCGAGKRLVAAAMTRRKGQ